MLRFSRHQGPIISCLFFRKYSSPPNENDELERERALRQTVLQKYPRFSTIRSLSSFSYESFSDSSRNINQDQFSSGPSIRRRLITLLLMGILTLWSFKLLFRTMSKDNLFIPLWAASAENQAKHYLFLIQFDNATQKSLSTSFTAIKELNPLADFFTWLSVQRPEFCSGYRYPSSYVIAAISNNIQSPNDMSRAMIPLMFQSSNDPRRRVDDFVDAVLLLSKRSSSLFPSVMPAIPPPNWKPEAVTPVVDTRSTENSIVHHSSQIRIITVVVLRLRLLIYKEKMLVGLQIDIHYFYYLKDNIQTKFTTKLLLNDRMHRFFLTYFSSEKFVVTPYLF
eukprot:gene9998-6978_t